MNSLEQISDDLVKPLHADKIKTRKNFGGGPALSYIEAHHAVREANRIFGHLGWSRETVSCEQVCTCPYESKGKDMVAVSYVARVRITVAGVLREGVGYGDGQAAATRAYSAHELAAKEAESDAMKRALMTFGDPFGLALYEKDKSKANVTTEPTQSPASKAQSRETYAKIKSALDGAVDMNDLISVWKDVQTDLKTLPRDWFSEITARKDEIKTHLQQAE